MEMLKASGKSIIYFKQENSNSKTWNMFAPQKLEQ